MTETPPPDHIILTPTASPLAALRLSVAAIGAWGTRTSGDAERTFVVTVWGERFDVGETLAQMDILMGVTPPLVV